MSEATEVVEAKPQDIATLPPADRAVIVMNSSKTEIQLRELVTESATITAVTDPAGRELAHRTGMRLKTARTSIEKIGKTAREDAQAFSKAVIAEEKRLIAITAQEEERVLSLRDAYDAKVLAEKAAKEAAERARVDGIQHKINLIRQIPVQMAGEPAAEIDAELSVLRDFVPGEEFGEFVEQAAEAAAGSIEALVSLHARAVAQEAEAARLAAERAELERLRQEQAEREAAARAEAQRLAEERERLEEERRALAAATAPTINESAIDLSDTGEDAKPFGVIYRQSAPVAVQMEPAVEVAYVETQAEVADAETIQEAAPQITADLFAAPDADEAAAIDAAAIDAAAIEADTFAPGDLTYDLCQFTATQFELLADKCDLCGAYQMGNYLRDIGGEIASGKHREAIASASPLELAEIDAMLSNACIASVRRVRND